MADLCGCYYTVWSQTYNTKRYLPQVDVSAHTTIRSTASSTVLTQTFVNPSSTVEVPKCKYVFPLYDGVSVVGFTCEIGPRTVTGVVKEKVEAKEVYDEAVANGKTAGLLEQGPISDVFMTSLGNIPAGEKLLVKITYIGELKHDVGADGLRFTLPTKISPRYSNAEVDLTEDISSISTGAFTVTVDVSLEERSQLQEIRSPSHPIAVTLGRISTAAYEPHNPSRASATLSLGTAALAKDFILEIVHQDSGKPKALLETHPTIPGQRALMTTLVPKAPYQQSKPEVIFVVDQSGSMQGERTRTLVAALKVFLKSLPVGIRFNICVFGTSHSFLFEKSQAYDQKSLKKAFKSLEGLDGTCGGTETLGAVKASIESRDPNEDLSMILATDGDIWQQQDLFDYLNKSVSQSKKSLRVFALGIGNSVSSALVEGVARAGNGFAQSVGNGEKLDGKVVRMLRGALSPDNGTFTMEIQYHKDEEEDIVLVERVTDSLRVMMIDESDALDLHPTEEVAPSTQATTGHKEADIDTTTSDANGQARYSHLPAIPMPKLLQTPQTIPPLYPFSRTTVYILISPDASRAAPKSIILRSDSPTNPFEMEIPVEILPTPSMTIHQLAAKKAISELEEGRGWLVHAKIADDSALLVNTRYPDQFPSMVEREAVRLGVQYQLAGKFTSFVAVDNSTSLEISPPKSSPPTPADSGDALARIPYALLSASPPMAGRCSARMSPGAVNYSLAPATIKCARKSTVGKAPRMQLASMAARVVSPTKRMFGRGSDLMRRTHGLEVRRKTVEYSELFVDGSGLVVDAENEEEEDPLQKIVAFQTFEGFWELERGLVGLVGLEKGNGNGKVDLPDVPEGLEARSWATILAITFLEVRMGEEKEVWEMVVEKARGWLVGVRVGEGEKVEGWWGLARELVGGGGGGK